MSAPRTPPRFSSRLLRLLVPPRHRDVVLDDLREGFDARVERDGPRAARAWYRREVRRCVGPAVRLRVGDLAAGRRLSGSLIALGQAARRLAAAPAFSVATIATLGIAMGVALTLFALVDAVLLRPLPYPGPDELVYLHHEALQEQELVQLRLSGHTAAAYRRADSVAGLGLWFEAAGNLTDGQVPERVEIAMVSPELLDVLGMRVALGRGFVRDDALADPVDTIILSHRLWSRRYGADPQVVGRRVEFNGRSREVVGVLPASLRFPDRGTEAWMPGFAEPEGAGLGNFDLHGLARLTAGTSQERAAAELEAISAEVVAEYPTFEAMQLRARIQPLHERVVGEWADFLRMLLAVGALVLGVAAANVGGLLLVRAEHQGHELAVRAALGAAGRARFRFHLAETALLCGAAALVALVIAVEGVPALVAAVPTEVPRLDEAGLDGRAVALTVASTAVLAILLALLVSGRRRAVDAASALRRSGGALADPRTALWRQALITGQLAIAVALISIASLLVRSAVERQQVDLGFDPEGVITAQVPLSFLAYREYSDAAGFWGSLLERVRTLPGVQAAGAIDAVPLADGAASVPLEVRDRPAPEPGVDRPVYPIRLVTPGTFEALGVSMSDGRFPDDGDAALRPVVVSESLAEALDIERGDSLRWARPDTEWSTVVGIVSDIRDRAPDAEPDAVLYAPVLARQSFSVFVPRVMNLVVKVERDPGGVVPGLRSAVGQLDALVPVTRVREMREWVAESTAAATFATVAISSAAAVAVLLAAVGLYGVVAYLVGRRRREIGIRLALGALPARIATLAVSGSLLPAGVGLALGALLGAAGTRLVASWTFAVSPLDPLAVAATGAILTGILVAATWTPTRRALRVDPASVLRG